MHLKTLYDSADHVMAQGEIKRAAIIELLAGTPLLEVLPFALWKDVDLILHPELDVGRRASSSLRRAGGDIVIDPAHDRSPQEAQAVRGYSRWLTRIMITGDRPEETSQFGGLVSVAKKLPSLTEALYAMPPVSHLLMSTQQRSRYSDQIIWDEDGFGRRQAFLRWTAGDHERLTPILITGKDERDEEILPQGVLLFHLGADGVFGIEGAPANFNDQDPHKTRIEWLAGLWFNPEALAYVPA